VAEYLCELPLRGRTLRAVASANAIDSAEIALASFIAGEENRLVAGAVNRLLNSDLPPGQTTSPLTLFGPSGTGKSHLARGLAAHWNDRCANSSLYLTADDFRRRFLDAIDDQQLMAFREQIRGRQLLVIDGLQQLPDDRHLHQELRYTLDAYHDDGGYVVATSDRPLGSLTNVPTDIRSRLAAGLTLQLEPPAAAARLHIIRQASAALGVPLADDAASDLALGVHGTANDLFGAIFKLCSQPNNANVSDSKRVDQLLSSRSARRPALKEIIAVVAKHLAIPQKLLKSGSRKQSIVFARAVVVFLARELSQTSYEEIGHALGGRDHTTIIHSYSKIERQRESDAATRETLDQLTRVLSSR